MICAEAAHRAALSMPGKADNGCYAKTGCVNELYIVELDKHNSEFL